MATPSKDLIKCVMKLDPDTLEVTVVCKADTSYITSEKTVSIKKFADQLKVELADWKVKEFYPKVDQLLKMIDDFNREVNKEYYEEVDRLNAPPLESQEAVEPEPVEKPTFFSKLKGLFSE